MSIFGHNHATSRVRPGGSSRSNPYALFRFFCIGVHTKDHAQLCGVISFSQFLCLVVISLMIFGALSMFYIVTGVIVYSLLMKSLFDAAEKLYVLLYMLFEALQIGFYMALIFYITLPIIFLRMPGSQCQTYSRMRNGTLETGEVCKRSNLAEEYMELLLFVLILALAKLYFARVFAQYYKFLVWNEKNVQHAAQYVNGRGVQICAVERQIFPGPPPQFWQNSVLANQNYGYDQHNDQHRNDVVGLQNLALAAALPSYAQAISAQKVAAAVPTVSANNNCEPTNNSESPANHRPNTSQTPEITKTPTNNQTSNSTNNNNKNNANKNSLSSASTPENPSFQSAADVTTETAFSVDPMTLETLAEQTRQFKVS